MSEPILDNHHFLKWMGLGTARLGLSHVMPGKEFWARMGRRASHPENRCKSIG